MSFIYAKKHTVRSKEGKNHTDIKIYSDTKTTLTGMANWGETAYKLINKYGMLKTIIPSADYCISYAGSNVLRVYELFGKLEEWRTFNFKCMIDEAYNVHHKATDEVEFIIAYLEDGELHLATIKDDDVETERSVGWIGSYMAFHKMQELREKWFDDQADECSSEMSLFITALKGCDDPDVGGLANVLVTGDCRGFYYPHRIEVSDQTVLSGKYVNIYGNLMAGLTSKEYIQDGSDLIVRLSPGDISIYYNNRYAYNGTPLDNRRIKYFKMPVLVRTSTGEVIDPWD